MGSASIRWGLILGAIAAALGTGAQLLGYALLPQSGGVPVDNAVGVLLITGLLGLLALALALGLAYFAGIRVERERPRTTRPAEATLLDPGVVNRGPGFAGLLVTALYWLVTTLVGIIGGAEHGGPADPSSFLTTRALLGLVLLAFGFGLGALGGRSPAARSLLDELAKGPSIAAVPRR